MLSNCVNRYDNENRKYLKSLLDTDLWQFLRSFLFIIKYARKNTATIRVKNKTNVKLYQLIVNN